MCLGHRSEITNFTCSCQSHKQERERENRIIGVGLGRKSFWGTEHGTLGHHALFLYQRGPLQTKVPVDSSKICLMFLNCAPLLPKGL